MSRRYDFDWLRIFGAVMVVIAHCALSFSPWTATLSSANAMPALGNFQTNKLFNELLWNLNLWLMPLFMLLAGASAWYTLRKRSTIEYLSERVLHLGLPLVILMLGFVVPISYLMKSAEAQFSGSLFEFYLRYFDGIAPTGNFALFHLWFLLYLLIYVLLTLPLFRFFEGAVGRQLIDKLARASEHRGGIYLFALPLLMVQLLLSGAIPIPEFPALVNDWTKFLSLLLVFIFGYILFSDSRFQIALGRQGRLVLSITLVTSTIMFFIAWQDDFNPYTDLPADFSWQYVAFWTVFALSSWSWLMTWLGFGQRYLNVNHPLLKRLGALSYPIYLLHPMLWGPTVFLIAQWRANPFIAFFVFTSIVLGGTLALCAIVMQWSFTRSLLGLKRKSKSDRVIMQQDKDAIDWSNKMSVFPTKLNIPNSTEV